MRRDSVIYLLSVIDSENEVGDPVQTTDRREVFADKKSVRQSEFYQAAASGLKPDLTFEIWADEYAGESQLEYEGQTYTIIRTFAKNIREMELVCSGLVNGVM